MNKAVAKLELSKELTLKNSQLTQKEAESIINDLFGIFSEKLSEGRPVVIRGFGTIKPVIAKAKVGRNLQTGESIKIPAKAKIKFVVGNELHEALNKNIAQ